MTDLLSKLVGKKVDLRCGVATSIRGEIIKVEGGVVQLRDSDDKICFVAIDKIVVVWEAPEEGQRAGFVS
ncbi:MAG: MM0924 family protein [Pyrinomonadaceae bacterium]